MNDLITKEQHELSTLDSAKLAEIVENLQKNLAINAITIQSMAAKIDQMERQLRYAIPLSNPQVRKINECIRKRADELVNKYGPDSAGARKRLANAIRKSICTSFGAGTVREIPKCEFTAACTMSGRWFDIYAYKKAVESIDRQQEGTPSAQRGGAAPAVPQNSKR